jgi:succinate-semialdehyde dehydrogenase / glutarate-semialdehyde dehydrogenase
MTESTSTYPDTQLLIDGAWRNGSNGEWVAVVNPATGKPIGRVAAAAVTDLDTALRAADRGFQVWRAMSAHERALIMRKASHLLRERAETIGTLMTLEQGKPLAEAKGEVLAAADIVEWFAEEARRAYGQIIPSRTSGLTHMAFKRPVGPVAAFTPWNFPINQVVRKLSAALAAGCSIIVKAPEETPASPAALLAAFVDAGIPAGTANLVFGDPAEISSYLIAHPIIGKISFTGSTAVGKKLAALAGEHMKLATMELGGHAPVLIFDDADLDQAVKVLAANKFRNAGQVCVSPTRFLVQSSAYDHVMSGFVEAARQIKVGNGLEPGVQMGPLANERRIPALEALIQDAVALGAELKTGGKRIGNFGNFFEPTVLSNVPVQSRIMNEEPFGPVAAFAKFNTLDEAIEEANRLRFGLASYAFTRSAAIAQQIGSRVEAGMTAINHVGLGLPELPFGGIGDSGHGTEGGSEAINAYFTTKLVSHLTV